MDATAALPTSPSATKGVSLRLVQELEGHEDRVWGVAWRPCDGSSILASCSGDQTVRIWEHSSGSSPSSAAWVCKAVLDSSHNRTVRQISWSPNGNLLASASFDATIGMWEYVGNEFSFIASFEGHENEVKSVAWNSAGTLLATCSRDKSVWIWEVLPGHEFECVSVLNGHTQDVKMVLWHPSLDILVSTSYDNTIKIWTEEGDGDDWHCAQTLGPPGSGHTSTVWAASFNATGDCMVTCSDDLTLNIWDSSADLSSANDDDSAKWKHLATISGYHDRTIYSVNWSSLNDLIASGAGDDCIRIFSKSQDGDQEGSQSYELVQKHEKAHTADVNCVQWHPKNPRLLASAGDDGIVKIWEVVGDLPHV
ncbi:protein CIA1 isoform X2 [Physcomitrium patens]|nr:protein CIA1-like isoform X2 [Physcomitrium patens]PNR32040.1 hypothetical protein PHYPA_026165 [Physcomitrium patens]|eukprot:XP_024358703.1 protein CIA1-like isoform X2 [Physcomitrella patens]